MRVDYCDDVCGVDVDDVVLGCDIYMVLVVVFWCYGVHYNCVDVYVC